MTLKGHYALCFKTRASIGAHHENLNEDGLYYTKAGASRGSLATARLSCEILFRTLLTDNNRIKALKTQI